MAFKLVGIDENSRFPDRVETQLAASEVARDADPASALRVQADARLSTTFADVKDALALSRLDVRGQDIAAKSLTDSQVAYWDADGLDERWVDTSAWSVGTTAFVVSGGKLYGPPSGDVHLGNPVPVSTVGRGLYRTKLATVTAGSERYTWAGWTSTAAGTQPTVATSLCIGVHTYPDGRMYPVSVDNGVIAQIDTIDLVAGTTLVINVGQDETQSWVEMTDTIGSKVWKITNLKTAFTPQQLMLRNDDARGVTGDSFDRVVGRAAYVNHSTNYYNTSPTGIWGIEPVGGQQFHVWLPAGWDARKATPLCIMPHGYGGNELSGSVNYGSANDWAVTKALLDAGYMVANSAALGGDNVGTGYAHYPHLWRYLTKHFPVGRVVIWSTSFGGPSGLRMIKEREIPDIAAWVGTYPVTNLADVYANNTTLRDAIDLKWGSLAAAQAAGADPNLYPATAFRGVRMHVRDSPTDNTVLKAGNVDLLKPRLDPYTDQFTVIATTGAHGDASNFTNLDTTEIVFLNEALGRQ